MSIIVPGKYVRKKDARLSFRTSKILEATLSYFADKQQRSVNAEFESIVLAFLEEEVKKEGLISFYCRLIISCDFIKKLIDIKKEILANYIELEGFNFDFEDEKEKYVYERHLIFKYIPSFSQRKLEDSYSLEKELLGTPSHLKVPQSLYLLYQCFSIDLLVLTPDLYESYVELDNYLLPQFLNNLERYIHKNVIFSESLCRNEPLVITFRNEESLNEKKKENSKRKKKEEVPPLFPLQVLDVLLNHYLSTNF